MNTYVTKLFNGDEAREFLETAKAGEMVIYYDKLHEVIDTGEQGMRLAVLPRKGRVENE